MLKTGKGAGTAVLAAAILLPAVPAAADETITAAPSNRYQNPNVTIDQGERLTFRNNDFAQHDVTSVEALPNGRALFASETIGNGQESFVEGSQYLTTGSYEFICSLHAFMKGTVTVTSAGTPVPRPDSAGPVLKLRIADGDAGKAASARKLRVKVTTDEAATIALVARVGSKVVAKATVSPTAAGSQTVSMKLSSSGRKALSKKSGATVKVSASARDAAGNSSRKSVTRKLK